MSAALLHERRSTAAPGLRGADGGARGQVTEAFVVMTEALNEQISCLDAEIGRLFEAHRDQHIFSSLPRSGAVRAATLLAEIGDCRERFPWRRRAPVRRTIGDAQTATKVHQSMA